MFSWVYLGKLLLLRCMFIKAHLVPLLSPGPVPDGDVVLNIVHDTQQVTTISLSSRNLVSSQG